MPAYSMKMSNREHSSPNWTVGSNIDIPLPSDADHTTPRAEHDIVQDNEKGEKFIHSDTYGDMYKLGE